MELKKCGSVIYRSGETPKLLGVVFQDVETENAIFWDRKITIGTLDFQKIMTLHDYSFPKENGGRDYQKQEVLCFDDFFVVDTTKQDCGGIEEKSFGAFSYTGQILCMKQKKWNEDQDLKCVQDCLKNEQSL